MLTRFISRSTFIAAIIAFALASFSATGVFAADLAHVNRDIGTTGQSLAAQWKAELVALKTAQYLDNNIGKWATKWLEHKRTFWRIHREARFANTANSALQQAEVLVTNHPGFDAKGEVIDKVLAAQSIKNLMIDLHKFNLEMRNRLISMLTK